MERAVIKAAVTAPHKGKLRADATQDLEDAEFFGKRFDEQPKSDCLHMLEDGLLATLKLPGFGTVYLEFDQDGKPLTVRENKEAQKGKSKGQVTKGRQQRANLDVGDEPPRKLPSKVREVVILLYNDIPRNPQNGQPVKGRIPKIVGTKKSFAKDWFTQRGGFSNSSPIRRFTAAELGMKGEYYRFLSGKKIGVTDYSEPYKKADGTPSAYSPTLVMQDRRSNRQFGKRSSQPKDAKGFDPLRGGTAAPLVTKAAMLYAIKNNVVTAQDLGMQRLGIQWSRLHRSAVALTERAVQQEMWVNEQRAMIDGRVKVYRQEYNKAVQQARQLEERNTDLQSFLPQPNVASALAEKNIAVPAQMLEPLPGA
ncbi:hypothetical protein Tdes44962_MAKER06102 [Teratosphaeria destructans]|uniref:Uncharacterized protein n=1 Tax=Teratosphaeria destructans TaxID=418781 RepID=A0A9W7SIJ5_9PEZI|nr:hypothetical protein Tdes44962_MAKER06102 [Teratosphaeria destructans]